MSNLFLGSKAPKATGSRVPKTRQAVFGKRAAVSRHTPEIPDNAFPGAREAKAKLAGKPIREKKKGKVTTR